MELASHTKATQQQEEEASSPSSPTPTIATSTATTNLTGGDSNNFSEVWTNALLKIRRPITICLQAASGLAARNPIKVVSSTIIVSIAILAIGLFTNFYVETDSDLLWTPTPSTILSHGKWLEEEAGFPATPRIAQMIIHADGQNVLSLQGMKRAFITLDIVQNTPGYTEVCKQATVSMEDSNNDKTCFINSPSRFWNYSYDEFEENVDSDSDVIQILSQENYPDGTPVNELSIFGTPERDSDGLLTSAQLLMMNIPLPRIDDSFNLEGEIITNVKKLGDEWDAQSGNIFHVEVFTYRSFDDEFERALEKDIVLVPMIFVIMSIFTCLIFFRRSWIHSHSLLGFGAVVTVLLSILSGYGILFIIGVPFTSMVQILPFIMFGIGLDDAFIIWGAYQRCDRRKESVERIHDTIEEIGISIFLTTITSIVAFSLGTISSIPAVYWLCQYATPTIAINFMLQITFFVALIVLDDNRVEKKRKDCIVCFSAYTTDDEELEPKENIFDRIMKWFGKILMKPFVKIAVLVIFSGMFGGLAYSATKLKQEFKFTDVLPSPSYAADFWNAFTEYTDVSGVAPYIIFRDVDQGDAAIQEQMEEYVNDIVDMKSISDKPKYFWLRDFTEFVQSSDDDVTKLPFVDQLDSFLSNPIFNKLYKDDIARDTDGKITASRVQVQMNNVAQDNVMHAVDALKDQRVVSESQEINKGKEDWAFFTFDNLYYIWQFYTECPSELMMSTILGVSSVSLIALVFIPHWTAVFFIAPTMVMLYIDLLGFLQLSGVPVNAVSYISLVMSIGLMVDFIMHILLRFYESKEATREEKVKDVLSSMGTSILIGAISTFLGVIPLAISSSHIFYNIFVTFLGLVLLGATHGLVFLPVLLSLFGPQVVLDMQAGSKTKLQQWRENNSDEV